MDQSVDTGLDTEAHAPSAEGPPPPAPEGGEAESDHPDIKAEVEEMRERYLRLAAEYDNFRKRTERERLEARDRHQAQIVEGLLESIDDLRRVADFSAGSTSVEALLEGVNMVERKFLKALEGSGLEMIEPAGQRFDPTMHEALFTAPTDDVDEDETVGQVLQPGYSFRGLLLRPARVEVRKHGG